MIDRFTEKAREAIQAAAELAAQLDHGYVGTEHLLLGLIREGTGVACLLWNVSFLRLPRRECRESWSIRREPDRCWKPAMRRQCCLKRR